MTDKETDEETEEENLPLPVPPREQATGQHIPHLMVDQHPSQSGGAWPCNHHAFRQVLGNISLWIAAPPYISNK